VENGGFVKAAYVAVGLAAGRRSTLSRTGSVLLLQEVRAAPGFQAARDDEPEAVFAREAHRAANLVLGRPRA